jgi:peptide/nickel transport system substrate-binding protein
MTRGLLARNRLSVIVLLAALAVAGCRRPATEGAEAEYTDPYPLPEDPLVVDAPSLGRHGGRFVFVATNNPRTFNAMMANETSSTDITDHNLFTYLVHYDNAKQQQIPMIAKSWETSADGLTWTFHLRRGTKFSDGHPLTSADVLFSAQVALDATLHPAVQDMLKVNGKTFEFSAPDPHTIVIKTAVPYATMLLSAGALKIMPKHVLEGPFKAGNFGSAYNLSTPPDQIVTSGPWRVLQYVPGEKTVLGRNPHWFGVDKANKRLPYLNELVYLIVPDQDAADLKFRARELDALDNVKPENYRWYSDNQKAGGFTLYSVGPENNSRFFWFNLNKVQPPLRGQVLPPGIKVGDSVIDPVKYAWFSNPVFRRAVSMAVDRDALIRSVFYGEGTKSWSLSGPSNKEWYTPDLPHYDYNVAESKRLLASIGFKDGNGDGVLEDTRGNPVVFQLKTNADNVMRVATANFVRDDLAKVGIRVILSPIDFSSLISNLRNDLQFEAILMGSQSGVPPDPAGGQNLLRSSGISHYFFVKQQKPSTPEEARIDQLLDQFVTTLDMGQRRAIWREIQTIWNEQGWFVWLPILNVKLPVSDRFGNVRPSVMAHRILWNIEQVYVK